MRQGDALKGPLFALVHYQAFLETIMRASNYLFPSLMDDTHIVGPMIKIILAFDHLSTQLAQVALKSKCQLWNPLRISLGTYILEGCILIIDGLRILGVLVGF
jgi:hypothetical protein